MHDAVCVDVEGDFDLRHATRCGRQVDELELAERLVVRRHLSLALQHVDLHRRLHVFGGGERLGTASRDGGVALDEPRHDAALGFDAERERCHVEKEDVLHVTTQDSCLHGGTDRDDFVGVDGAVRLFAGE